MPPSWWIRVLYAVLAVSALALATLLVGDVVYALEDEEEHETHDHSFYGPIFDGAWLVFLPTAFVTLVAGASALTLGGLRRNSSLVRYGGSALAYIALAVSTIVLVETFD